MYERFGATTNLISQGPAGGTGPHASEFVGASTDGTRVFFQTYEQLVSRRHRRDVAGRLRAQRGRHDADHDRSGEPRTATRSRSGEATRWTARAPSSRPTSRSSRATRTPRGTRTRGRLRSPAIRGRRAAHPLRVALVPAYEACTSPNRDARAPAGASVVQPAGPALAGVDGRHAGRERLHRGCRSASVRFRYRGTPTPPEDSEVEAVIKINDVHCRVTNAACPGGPGSDFVGSCPGAARRSRSRTSSTARRRRSPPPWRSCRSRSRSTASRSTGNEGGRCDADHVRWTRCIPARCWTPSGRSGSSAT